MKTVVKKTQTLETKRHNYDNDFAYVEIWSNASLKDCYFAEKTFLFPDGTLKNGGKKYFPCNPNYLLEKVIRPYDYEEFTKFEWLYYIDECGDIVNINRQEE